MGDAGEPPLGLDETTKYDWEPAPPATLFKEVSEGRLTVPTGTRAATGLDSETPQGVCG